MILFSVAKMLQRVVKYFCSEMCPRFQRIFGILLRIFGARKIRVALELEELARVLEAKNEYFSFKKNMPSNIVGLARGEMMVVRRRGNTWVKIKGYPSG